MSQGLDEAEGSNWRQPYGDFLKGGAPGVFLFGVRWNQKREGVRRSVVMVGPARWRGAQQLAMGCLIVQNGVSTSADISRLFSENIGLP